MKIVGIGDLFIPKQYINEGFKILKSKNVEIQTLDWKLKDFDELQEINLLVEKGGCEAYDAPDYLLEATKDADILITQFCPITKKIIDNCNNLKVIGVLRAGYENINLGSANEKNIIFFNTPGRNAEAVADFTVGMIICEARNIARGHHGLKNGEWIRTYPNSSYIPDLTEKTVGLVGLGEIGYRVVKKLSGFNMKIIAYDPYIKDAGAGIELVELDYLMKNSDFVSIHARLTAENEKMINKELLQLMKPTSYFINTGRAGLVDENALYEILKNSKIAGAALDVFMKEPPGKDYPLVILPNVTITPHMAGGSTDAFLNSPKKLAAEMIKLWDKKESRQIINKEVFQKIVSGANYPFIS
jgi:D-3-phosphoglycerate dehydrogenase / 2-oxoglutarate reductase